MDPLADLRSALEATRQNPAPSPAPDTPAPAAAPAPADDPLADLRSALTTVRSTRAPAPPQATAPPQPLVTTGPLADLGQALADLAQGATQGPATLAQATRDVPLVGGATAALAGAADFGRNAVGGFFEDVGRRTSEAIPAAGEELRKGAEAAGRLPEDVGYVFGRGTPPDSPEGFKQPGGPAAIPRALGDLITTLFAVPNAANQIGQIGLAAGVPATGALATLGTAGIRQYGDILKDIQEGRLDLGRHDATARDTLRMLLDPTRAQRAFQSETQRLIGDVPVAGGLADLLMGGQILNPANYVGMGLAGTAARATRAYPAVSRALRGVDVADRYVSRAIGAPVELPVKGFGLALRKTPIMGQLTRQAKFANELERLAQAGKGYLDRGGEIEDFAAIARGERPVTMLRFTPEEQKAIREVADAATTAKRATGGKVKPTTEAEFLNALGETVAKRFGMDKDPNPLQRAIQFLQATFREGVLALNPSYYIQNNLGNRGVGIFGGFTPAGPEAWATFARRYGLPEGLAGDLGYTTAMLGKQKGLLRTLPGINRFVDAVSTRYGSAVENGAKYGALLKRIREVMPDKPAEAMQRIRAAMRAATGRDLDPEMERRLMAFLLNGATPKEVAAFVRGEGPWYTRMKDWGEHLAPHGPMITELEQRLAALEKQGLEPRSPGWKAAKDAIFDEFDKRAKARGQTIAGNRWMGAGQMAKTEGQAFDQLYANLRADDNPEAVLEKLYGMRAAVEASTQLSAKANAAAASLRGKANNAQRQALYRGRHEQVTDWLDAAHAVAAMVDSHAYGTYSAAIRGDVKTLIGGMIDSLDRMRRTARAYEKAAAKSGGAITEDMVQQFWEGYHKSVLDVLDNVGSVLAGMVAGPERMRGPGFWSGIMGELADQSYRAREGNRAQIAGLFDNFRSEMARYKGQLDRLPDEIARTDGMGLMESPAQQAMLSRIAAGEWGKSVAEAYADANKFKDKWLFNYQNLTNWDKLLGFASPFMVWQTRSIPLWAEILAQRPGMLRAFNEAGARAEQARAADEGVPTAANGTFLRSSPLDPLYSALIGRPVETYADPFGMVFQGGGNQFDSQPYIPVNQRTGQPDMGTLGQLAKVGGWMGGGLSLWPWWQAALNLTDQNGRQVSYGDLFAPSRALRAAGVDIERPTWQKFLLNAQGIESETGDTFLDRRIRERIAQIGAEDGDLSEADLLRAMGDPSNPLHQRARSEAEKESNIVSLLRYILPLGVKTVSPGGRELAQLEKQYGPLKGTPAGGDFLKAHPELAALFQKNASEAKLEIQVGQAEYNALGTPRQRELTAAYNAMPRDQQRAYAEAHPKDYAEIRSLLSLRSKFRQDPNNAMAVAWQDANNRDRDAGGDGVSVDDFLYAQGIPERRQQQDTRNPMQDLATALTEVRGKRLVAAQQEQGAFGAKLDAYYAVSDPVKGLSDQYFALPEGSRERSQFLRQHPDLTAAWDRQRAMRDSDAELAAYVAWSQRRRAAGQESGLADFLDERRAGRAPTPPKSTGTAANPSRAA